MKHIRKLRLLLLLVSISSLLGQDEWIFPQDSATIGIFFCDFQSGNFEGAFLSNHQASTAYGSINLPLDTFSISLPLNYYFQEGDDGSRWEEFSYSGSNEVVFSAHVLSSDVGTIYSPTSIIPSSQFGSNEDRVERPVPSAWIDPSGAEDEYPSMDSLYRNSWNSIANLNLIHSLSQVDFETCVYLYIPTIDEYATAKTIIFIYKPASLGTSTFNYQDVLLESFKVNMTAYPNPFNASTQIRYTLPFEGNVVIRIYNVLGENISSIQGGFQLPGSHQLQYISDQTSSEILFYRIHIDGYQSRAKKLISVK